MPIDYKEAIAKILELLDYVEKQQSDFSEIDDKKFGLVLEYGSILDNYIEQYAILRMGGSKNKPIKLEPKVILEPISTVIPLFVHHKMNTTFWYT